MTFVARRVEPPGDLVVEDVLPGSGDGREDRHVPDRGHCQGGQSGEGDAPEGGRSPDPPVGNQECEQRGQLDQQRGALGEQAEPRGDAGENPGPPPGAIGRSARSAHDAEPGPRREAGQREIRSGRVAGDERQERSSPGERREVAGVAIPERAAESSDGDSGRQEEEGEADPRAPFVLTQQSDAAGHAPEQERRLVEEIEAGEVRQQPVAGGEHRHRDARVAAFIGFPEAARALEGEGEQQQEKNGGGARGDAGGGREFVHRGCRRTSATADLPGARSRRGKLSRSGR